MADGICALGRSVRTVGCFTDVHGRGAVAARSPGSDVIAVGLPPGGFRQATGAVSRTS
jgi:hypothetical protein